MKSKSILLKLVVFLLLMLGILGASGVLALPQSARNHSNLLPLQGTDWGDAPEGQLAYSASGVVGNFPTCMNVPLSGWVQHFNFGAFFGPMSDFEPEGNAGICPQFQPYDADECFQDNDAGLLIPEPYTIQNGSEQPCPNALGTFLGTVCQTAVWGQDIDIDVTNFMPNDTPGFVNVLMDWNQDGKWSGSSPCPGGGTAPEHVLVNYPVPNEFTGPLSMLGPSGFLIGPNPNFVWTRFTITEQPVPLPWTGEGFFEDGETEDYLLRIDAGQQIEHKMHYPQWPDPNGWDVNATEPKILADDFLCTESGPITNVIFWGSWRDDVVGSIENIHLSFHDDDRSGPFSKPGNLLWEWDTNNFIIEEVEPPSLQGWYDPNTGWWEHPNHQRYFRYEVAIPSDIAFVQDAGNIYWLDLQFFTTDGILGWKTSLQHFEDDGVWGDIPSPIGWQELIDPITGESLDLAFVIQGVGEEFDFGDAPDPTYPTLLFNNGAAHLIDPTFYLGTGIDPEPDGQPDVNAEGDDQDIFFPPPNDDEDGISFVTTPLIPGQMAIIDVQTSSSVINPQPGFLDGWIDFNGDGDWDDSGEQIFAATPLSILGFNSFFVPIPLNAQPGSLAYARFRLSRQGGLNYFGLAQDGEVEDYIVPIGALPGIKWMQPPEPSLPGLHAHGMQNPPPEFTGIILADDWLCEGGLVTDLHWWGNYELDPTGQEIRGAGIDHFHLSIHAVDGNCLPAEPELWSMDVPFADVAETATGMLNLEGSPIYLYTFLLDQPFEQEAGQTYWFDIRAVYIDPQFPAYWRWQEAARTQMPQLCPAAENNTPPPSWQHIVWPNGNFSDMAFAITSQAPPAAPQVDIVISSPDDVKLYWPHVTTDIFGQPLTVVEYRIYRDTSPYFMLGGATLVDVLIGPFPTSPIEWVDPNVLGSLTPDHFYYVEAVTVDWQGNMLMSAPSNHVGEFEFKIVPGTP